MPWINKPCLYCKVEFTSYSWKTYERKYCSHSCKQKYMVENNRKNMFGGKLPDSKRMSICKECGKEIWKRHLDKFFCGTECYLTWRRKNTPRKMMKCIICGFERLRKISEKKNKIEVIHADNRYKFITGLNTAISLNRDLLFFMQNDVVLEPDCVANMIRYKRPTNFMAQPLIYDTSGKIDNSGMDIYWPGYGLRRKNKWWHNDTLSEKCGLVTTICFLTDNKSIFYDTKFTPAYYEDLDFYLRTRKTFTHILIPSASVIHRGNHTFSQTLTKIKISNICRANRKNLICKHYSGLNKWLRLTVSSCFDVVKKTIDIIRDWRTSLDIPE